MNVKELVDNIFKTPNIFPMSTISTIYGVDIKIEYIPLKGFVIAFKFDNNVEMLFSELIQQQKIDNEIDTMINSFVKKKLQINEYNSCIINILQSKYELIETINNGIFEVVQKNINKLTYKQNEKINNQ